MNWQTDKRMKELDEEARAFYQRAEREAMTRAQARLQVRIDRLREREPEPIKERYPNGKLLLNEDWIQWMCEFCGLQIEYRQVQSWR
jgi:rubrerythrin